MKVYRSPTGLQGLAIDTSLTWRHHITELTSRLNKPFMSTDVPRTTYFLYVHSIISYGIIFWGNSSHSEDIFKIQKRIVRLIMNSGKKASCQQLSRELDILPVQSQYILSILLFVAKIKDQFISNSQVHKINTRQTSDLHIPIANLTTYQKCVYCQGIKIYNNLPRAIKDLSSNKNKFTLALKKYLLDNSFYSLKEYFDA
jgi:hypothetical protein